MDKMAVTGGAGFIGSNLAEHLLSQGHEVLLIDNFSTGRESNLKLWAERAGDRVKLLRADVNETEKLRHAFRGVLYVFHQAAIPSVPRSIEDPKGTESSNINGSLSLLLAARDAGVRRVVLASSSSVYGDDHNLLQVEDPVGRPHSPYALSKSVGEQYCRLFYELYGLETVCLRYFNVFGPRQDPKSEYAAVIPRFCTRLLGGKRPTIYGDGEQSRDFTYVANVVEANWRAATHAGAAGEVFNIGCGIQTSLNQLIGILNGILDIRLEPIYEPARKGDIRHSFADVKKAERVLDFHPAIDLQEGLKRVVGWYREHPEDIHGVA
ncbi:MAG: LPS biosynthesis protein WbpP [Acidobacteria bacterium]|nr:MAG: LPS biosynthesis protein WbpP [Acidobacteriota bacterium]